MLHVGLDLSRKRVDVCLISSEGELVEHFRSPCDRDGLYGPTRRVDLCDRMMLFVRRRVSELDWTAVTRSKVVSHHAPSTCHGLALGCEAPVDLCRLHEPKTRATRTEPLKQEPPSIRTEGSRSSCRRRSARR